MVEKRTLPEWWPELESKVLALVGNLPSEDYEAVDPGAIRECIRYMRNLLYYEPSWPMPSVHPVPDGGISVEWHTERINAEIKFDPTIDVNVLITNVKTGEETVTDHVTFEMDANQHVYTTLRGLLGEEDVPAR